MSTLVFDSLDSMPAGMRSLVEKQLGKAQPKAEKKKAPKYHNSPTERQLANGNVIKFRSEKEAKYFDSLILLERAGQVRKIRLEVQYLLKPAYTDAKTGERYRAISYLADFVFERREPNGCFKEHIVDTKGGNRKGGTRTSTYQLKKKLMADAGFYIEEI